MEMSAKSILFTVRKKRKYELANVSINCKITAEAKSTAAFCGPLFGWQIKENTVSVFARTEVECLKQPSLGKYALIVIAVEDVSSAV